MDDADPAPSRADWYRHDDVDEIVFAVDEGRVLTVREYPSVDRFRESVRSATHVGTHEGVADLPDVDEFDTEPE